MNWTDLKDYKSWAEFRDEFYYPSIVGRKWNGTQNKKFRKSDQSAEQIVHDAWRKHMGFDAPWTDIMLFYDHGKVIGLGEVKCGTEDWSSSNKKAAENCAERLGVPLVLMVFKDKKIYVSVYDTREQP